MLPFGCAPAVLDLLLLLLLLLLPPLLPPPPPRGQRYTINAARPLTPPLSPACPTSTLRCRTGNWLTNLSSCARSFDSHSNKYVPFGREWIKKQVFEQLKKQAGQ